ncbi:hypothetical protein [Brassicibacter mesophilus]|uniref:hypothetical protein n=1 Tax=Brassicibacter mesophilus TaxID=745119 RepID=UPI003D1DC5DD
MNLYYVQSVLVMLLLVSTIGYIFVVIKEKLYLKDNTIIINKKSITQEHIDETDMKVFVLGGVELKSGDEIKFTLLENKRIEGILIGAKIKENEIIVVTHTDEVKRFKVDKIKKVKIISKYGKFFK